MVCWSRKLACRLFIVTLGTLNVYTALSLLMSGARAIAGANLRLILTWTAIVFPLGPFQMTTGALIMIAIYLVLGYALSQTAWGTHVYAVGDDGAAARLSSIPTTRVPFSVYGIGGVIFAISTWILIGRVGAATTNSAVDTNLDSITATVIGGTSLFGGRGRLLGTLIGALTVGVSRNGLSLGRVHVLYQNLTIGLLIIAAVTLDQWIRRIGKS